MKKLLFGLYALCATQTACGMIQESRGLFDSPSSIQQISSLYSPRTTQQPPAALPPAHNPPAHPAAQTPPPTKNGSDIKPSSKTATEKLFPANTATRLTPPTQLLHTSQASGSESSPSDNPIGGNPILLARQPRAEIEMTIMSSTRPPKQLETAQERKNRIARTIAQEPQLRLLCRDMVHRFVPGMIKGVVSLGLLAGFCVSKVAQAEGISTGLSYALDAVAGAEIPLLLTDYIYRKSGQKREVACWPLSFPGSVYWGIRALRERRALKKQLQQQLNNDNPV